MDAEMREAFRKLEVKIDIQGEKLDDVRQTMNDHMRESAVVTERLIGRADQAEKSIAATEEKIKAHEATHKERSGWWWSIGGGVVVAALMAAWNWVTGKKGA